MTGGNLHHYAGRLVPLLLLALATPAGAAEAWRCSAPAATAYRYDPVRDRWETLVIPVSDQEFLVQSSADPGQGWEVRRPGAAAALAACPGDFSATGLLRCGTDFEMNRNTLAFTSHLFQDGGLDARELTAPTVTGRCRPL